MKTERLSILACLTIAGALAATALNANAANLPSKEKFKLVVLTGQSNMAGRGKIDPADNKAHPRVLMLNVVRGAVLAGGVVVADDPVLRIELA